MRRFPVEALFSHSYCVGRNGSGKSTFLTTMFHFLVKKKYPGTSIVLIDPHGDLAQQAQSLNCINKKDLIIIDPVLHLTFSPTINPFDIVIDNVQELSSYTDSFLGAFEALLADQNISGAMEGFLGYCINCMIYHPNLTLFDLYVLLSGFSNSLSIKNYEFSPEEKRLITLGKEVPEQMTQIFFDRGWKEIDRRTIKAIVNRMSRILRHQMVRDFLVGPTTINLEKALNSGKIIIINLSVSNLGEKGSEAIGRLLISSIQNIAKKRNSIPKEKRPRTVMFIDECQRFMFKDIEKGLSEFRKFNFSLFLAHQYAEQISSVMFKALLSNCRNKIVGANSAANAKLMSPEMGVLVQDLIDTKPHTFRIKSEKRMQTYLVDSTPLLLQSKARHLYLSNREKISLDNYMLQKYYRPVSINTGDMDIIDEQLDLSMPKFEFQEFNKIQVSVEDF